MTRARSGATIIRNPTGFSEAPVLMLPRLPLRASTRAIASLALLVLIGCGIDRHDPLRPTDASLRARPFVEEGAASALATANSSGFYPLVIGNAWTYATRFEITLIDSAGNASLGDAE